MQNSLSARKRSSQEGKAPAVFMSEDPSQACSQDGGQSFISTLKSDLSLNFSKTKLTNPVPWVEQWIWKTLKWSGKEKDNVELWVSHRELQMMAVQ